MPELVAGYTFEQKRVTVPNTDVDVNAEIETQGLEGWITQQLLISGSDMIILFTRQIPVEET